MLSLYLLFQLVLHLVLLPFLVRLTLFFAFCLRRLVSGALSSVLVDYCEVVQKKEGDNKCAEDLFGVWVLRNLYAWEVV